MIRESAFASLHPTVCFLFFAGALVLGMCFRHPAHVTLAVVLSAVYCLTVGGRGALRAMGGVAVVFVLVAVLNPLFNTRGDTILFTYLSRPYTLEALLFGCMTAGIFASMLLWFWAYNAEMTSDKFTYLFGSLVPAISLVFCMVLRLVPRYQRRFGQMAAARSCVGQSTRSAATGQRVHAGLTLFGALTSWALEDAVVSSDSMRARGYGVGRRTSFAQYRFGSKNALLAALLLCSAVVASVAYVAGGVGMEFYPRVVASPPDAWLYVSAVAYGALLGIPSLLNLRESLLWRFSLSQM